MIWDRVKIQDIIKIYFPILISVAAIIIAIRSCDISRNSLNISKQEFEKRREVRLFVGAKWTGDKIYSSHYFKGKKLESIGNVDLYGGLEGFIVLNVTNISDHAVSIDDIRIRYCSKSSVMSIQWGNKFKTVDMQDDISFPIMLDAYEPFQCITRVPIPISANLSEMMSDLHSDTTYSSKDIVMRLADFVIKTKAESCSPDSIEKIIKKEIGFLSYMTSNMQNVPEILISYSNPDPDFKVTKVIRGQRALEILVKLSSGEKIAKILDYIDINRSSFDY